MTAARVERFDSHPEYLGPVTILEPYCGWFPRNGSAILKMNCNGYLGWACCSRILLIDRVRKREKFSHGSADFPAPAAVSSSNKQAMGALLEWPNSRLCS